MTGPRDGLARPATFRVECGTQILCVESMFAAGEYSP